MDIFVKPPRQSAPELTMDNEVIDDADDFEVASTGLEPFSLQLDDIHQGERLDKVLATLLPQFSRARLQQWIEEGWVLVDGKPAKIRTTVLGGENISVEPQAADHDQAFVAEPLDLRIVHEDDALIIVNKPAGLVVHPAAGN